MADVTAARAEHDRVIDGKQFPPTEYQYEYIKYLTERRRPIIPKYSRTPAFVTTNGGGSGGVGEGYLTENRNRFVAHELPEKVVREKAKYQPSPHKLESQSVQHADFQPWWTHSRSLPIRHPPTGPTLLYHTNPPPTFPSTTQRSDFASWPPSRRAPIKPLHTKAAAKAVQPGKDKTPDSTYSKDFGEWDVVNIKKDMIDVLSRQVCRIKGPPTVGETGEGGMRDYATTMRRDFVNFGDVRPPMPKGHKNSTTIDLGSSLPASYFSPRSPHTGSTIYSLDFQQIPAQWNGAGKSLKPIRKYERADENRDFLSETMVSYTDKWVA